MIWHNLNFGIDRQNRLIAYVDGSKVYDDIVTKAPTSGMVAIVSSYDVAFYDNFALQSIEP